MATLRHLFLLGFCFLTCYSSSQAVICPMHCKCVWVLESLEVHCSALGLNSYPVLDTIPVEYLDLSRNNFTEFPTQYADIESLIHLDLSNNQIEYIEAGDLLGFTSLRTLLLANNSISSWSHINPNEAFRYATSLKRLSLSGNHLTNFNDNEPSEQLKCQTLAVLELADCGITSVGGDQLINNLPNLERLVLSDNRLLSLTALPSKSLRALELRNCSLQRVSGQLLAGLPSLEALNIAWNTALQFGSGLDLNLVTSYSLTHLDASYCNLDEVDLSGLPSLTVLRLRGNMLRTISARSFANNSLLEFLDLSRNALRVIELNTFSQLKRLAKLDLAYNEIATLDRNIFRSNDVLTSLNLSRNVFEKFTKIVSNSLRDINLSWCEITTIDSMALSGFSSLQRLDLSNNLIRDIPSLMRSLTLQTLDLRNCRLSTIRNNTFRELPELGSLYLSGNRFTNPMATEYFRSNKYLDQIWLGDNPWICNCHDPTFVDFYDFLIARPQKLKDKNNLRCAAPPNLYGKTWELACYDVWLPNARSSSAEKVWSTVVIVIMLLGIFVFAVVCLQKFLKGRKERNDEAEFQSNQDEMQEIRRLNQRLLQEEASSNAPSCYETNLPSYEDALRMPKLVRPAKSMVDLTASERSRKRLRRSQTVPDNDGGTDDRSELEDECQLDTRQRFRSVEMLANRDKERTAQIDPCRRTGRVNYNNSGTRRLSIENSRFPAAHLKSQNLQSAEQIGNFQSYENSPYTKRKPQIAEIPPFKRATMRTDSVEFLTDPEYEDITNVQGNVPKSPFAKRKPKPSANVAQVYATQQDPGIDVVDTLTPAIENYFGIVEHHKQEQSSSSSSTEGSAFHVVIEPDVVDENRSTDSNEHDIERGRRKKRKNSASRRVSGSFSAAADKNSFSSSSSLECYPIVVVHKPMRETLF